MELYKKGTDLQPDDQDEVLRAYVHRYTKKHIPAWAHRPEHLNTKPQFRDDADWLENTLFHVRKDGRLDKRFTGCVSTPTWPDGK